MRYGRFAQHVLSIVCAGWTLLIGPAFSKDAASVPLPPARPDAAKGAPAVEPADHHLDCEKQLGAIGAVDKHPVVTGAGGCGGSDLVALRAVMLPAGASLTLVPPAVLRCGMALALSQWLRDEVAPLFATKADHELTSLEVAASYECRGQNRVAGAKLSEHGTGNAIDLSGFSLSSGRSFLLTDIHEPKSLREELRQSACKTFTTVLGPGSDGYHETHVHLDLRQRQGGYRICQWDIRD